MATNEVIAARATQLLGDAIVGSKEHRGEITFEIDASRIRNVCESFRDNPSLQCEELIDLCGVDYSTYGEEGPSLPRPSKRFAVVYNLLSVSHNHRIRLKAFIGEDTPVIDSVVEVWASANWFEREAFDLFGIIFEGHPDLRRILTDYGFIGHPFRKDFPLIGNVEMRYDPEKGRVVYQPVTIEARTLVPRIIREEGFGDRNS
jgi:NADH-quinone oxidoreductase subunit C